MGALTELLAGQTRAEEHHAALLRRLDQSDEVQRQVIQALSGMTDAFRSLREAVDQITQAANGEKPKKGADLGVAIAALTAELQKQGKSLDRAVQGIERLPELLLGQGFAAEDLRQPNGSADPVRRRGGGGNAD